MGGYLLLLALIFLFSSLKNKELGLVLMFVVITIFSGIRYGIGYDYYSYLEKCLTGKIDVTEPIPYYMMDFSNRTVPFLFFLFSSIFISVFYYLSIRKKTDNYLAAVIFYICFPFLFMNQLSVIRQGMATAVLLFAITLHDKKLIYRIALIIVACMCHTSAIVGFLILLPWGRFSKQSLWILFLSSFLVGTAFVPFIQMIVDYGFLGDSGTERATIYLSSSNVLEGRRMKYFIYALLLLALINYDRLVKLHKENSYYIGLMCLGASFCVLFSFQSTLAIRLCMLFFATAIYITFQLFKVLHIPNLLYYFVFISLFALQIYLGSNIHRDYDSPGYSVTYPYRTVLDNYAEF